MVNKTLCALLFGTASCGSLDAGISTENSFDKDNVSIAYKIKKDTVDQKELPEKIFQEPCNLNIKDYPSQFLSNTLIFHTKDKKIKDSAHELGYELDRIRMENGITAGLLKFETPDHYSNDSIIGYNIISIGNQCINPVTRLLDGSEHDCSDNKDNTIGKYKGVVRINKINGRNALTISGWSGYYSSVLASIVAITDEFKGVVNDYADAHNISCIESITFTGVAGPSEEE